jgi:predicted heme/steroid binding protein/rubrerythrin
MDKSYKTLNEALALVKEAIQDEREDELFYDYLISVAPTKEERDIIASIRDDERKHNKYFREIYAFYTGKSVPSPSDVTFENPQSYIAGIRKAKFGELGAVERYRDIRAGIPDRYYRDMVFEILTDELKHTHKYDYILYLSSENNVPNSNLNMRSPVPPAKTSFTTEEAAQIARELGIDFNKEKFNLEQFRMGLDTELEHGRKYNPTNVTEDNPLLTGKIALAHLSEFPDYYTRLKKLEEEAKAYWSSQRNLFRQTREFTLAELAQYDGAMGRPAYVAVNGVVYDVSNERTWGGASHFGLMAGNDLSAQFKGCHGRESILTKLPKVGILKV